MNVVSRQSKADCVNTEILEVEANPQVMERIAEDFKRLAINGVHNVDGKYCVTGYEYKEFYDWDLYFECLALSYCGVNQYAKNGVELFLDKQRIDGFVPRTQELVWERPGQMFKPFLCQTAALYVTQTHDGEWLRGKRFLQLENYLNYWFSEEYDANKNGLPAWNSADHTGMDNVDERAGAIDSYVCEGVDLAVYIVREYQAMQYLAEQLDMTEKANEYRLLAENLSQLIQSTFWCDQDKFFYDINVRTGEFIRVKTVAGFAPLWIGAATNDQAKCLIENHLLNPDEFWLDYPVAAMSKKEPGFRQERYEYETCCNWKGSTWMPTNYYVLHGLINYGYQDAAKELAQKTQKMVLKNQHTREYYNSETGDGLGLDPFWGWSILGGFFEIERVSGLSPAHIGQKEKLRIVGHEYYSTLFKT